MAALFSKGGACLRKLALFTVGFAAGVFLCAQFYGQWIICAAIALLLITAAIAVVSKVRGIAKRTLLVVLGCTVGLLWFLTYDRLFVAVPRVADGQTGYVSIEASDYSQETDNGISVEGNVTLAGKSYRVKAYLRETVQLKPGDVVSGYFRFRLTTKGGENNATSHQSEGIFLIAYPVSNAQIEQVDEIPSRYYPAKWRQELQARIEQLFPEDTAGFAKALLLGDRTDITYEINTALKVSGISHVIAVSGLHVSILFGMIYTLLAKRRWLSCLIGIPVLLLFAAVVGFTPSISRACIMQILMLIAMALDREYDAKTALAFAVIVMLVVNPMAILSVSLQLSAVSVLGILMFSERIKTNLLPKQKRGTKPQKSILLRLWYFIASSTSVTLSAMIFTTPLVAYYFGCVSMVGVLTNLLTLWVITFIFYGILLCLGISFVSVGTAAFVGKIFSVPIRFVLWIAAMLSKLPMAAVYTMSIYVVVWLIGCYLLFAVFLLQKRKRPILLVSCIMVTFLLSQVLAWTEPMLEECRVTVLNVGQGQSILLQADGKTFLVDCGGDDSKQSADVAAQTLFSQGISRLDGIILTHYDDDHAAGLPYLLTQIKTDRLILPDIYDEKGIGSSLAQLSGGSVEYVCEDIKITFADTEITIIGPISYETGNESSLCVLFRRENCDILITGDRGEVGEAMLLREHQLPQLELLIAGHHGSATSTGEALLAETLPATAIISVGADNSYGHPSDEVLQRLAKVGCEVFRTDIHGTIIFRR